MGESRPGRGWPARRRDQRGVSLVEVLVVIAVLIPVVLAATLGLLTSARLATNTKASQELNAAAASFAESLKEIDYVDCAAADGYDGATGLWEPPADANITIDVLDRRVLGPVVDGLRASWPTPTAPTDDEGAQLHHHRADQARRRHRALGRQARSGRVSGYGAVMTKGHLRRRRSQTGVTLIETLAVLAISSLIMIPILGWGFLAIQEQEAVYTRNTDGASIGLLRTYFVRDVASAADAKIGTYAEDTDCSGGEGAGTGAQTLLRLGGDDDEYVVYNQVTSSEGVGLSIWRRECDGSTLAGHDRVVDRVAVGRHHGDLYRPGRGSRTRGRLRSDQLQRR